mgnify:FL=1
MASLGRASVLLASGTLVSRILGFVRAAVLVAAIGAMNEGANAFAIANQLPNNIYTIIASGILSAVLVPQIVRANGHADGGKAYINKLFTIALVVLLLATVAAMLLAPLLIQLYTSEWTEAQRALGTSMAYWCLPQIFFYGLYALLGEVLNAKKVFGPFTWAPIINNVIALIGLGFFISIFGIYQTGEGSVADWTPDRVALLGTLTTLGVAAQALILLVWWRRSGLSYRPDFRWRGVGLRSTGKLASWTFGMVIAGQLAGIVQSRVASIPADAGFASVFVMSNAWLIFMLPHSIIAVSIGTAYFTQLSEHAVAGRLHEVRKDVGTSIRTLSLFMVIGTVAIAIAAMPASRIFTNSATDSFQMAQVLWAYLVGLVPFAVLFVVQRTFYALGDTRTPFFFTLFQCTLVVITALLASLLPLQYIAVGVALGQSVAGIAQAFLATWLLKRRLGHIGSRQVLVSLVRFAVASVPAAVVGYLVLLFVGGTGPDSWALSGVFPAIVATSVIGAVTGVVYLGVLALIRTPELAPAVAAIRRR